MKTKTKQNVKVYLFVLYPIISGLSHPTKNPISGAKLVVAVKISANFMHAYGVIRNLYTMNPPMNVPSEAEQILRPPKN